MKRALLLPLGCLLQLGAMSVLAQVSGPDDRTLTDPQSVASAANAGARAIPIDDLYVTRRVADAAWSPDGKQIAFSTDLTGRMNIWKVDSAGGWPVQLTQSNEQQRSATWSPDGKWVAYQQDHGGNELWDVFVVS